MRLLAYGAFSGLLTSYIIFSAFRTRSNFYSAAVFLGQSHASILILWNFGLFFAIMLAKLVQAVFFGTLRSIELERLHERTWYAVTESLLALTIFRDEFDTMFVILFVTLLLVKMFHWLAADRVEWMEQMPNVTRLFHMRMAAVITALLIIDAIAIRLTVRSVLVDGPSVSIMLAAEYAILLATLFATAAKYALNVVEMRSEQAWEAKSIHLLHVELVTEFIKLVTYSLFFALIVTFYGLPLNLLRDLYVTARSFVLKVRDLRRYRVATRDMDTKYPNATLSELDNMTDKTCIICREEMEARPGNPEDRPPPVEGDTTTRITQQPLPAQGPNDTPKKLACGHVFHFHCLKSWLERQQSCPTCRRSVLTDLPPVAQPGVMPAGRQPPAELNPFAVRPPGLERRHAVGNGDPPRTEEAVSTLPYTPHPNMQTENALRKFIASRGPGYRIIPPSTGSAQPAATPSSQPGSASEGTAALAPTSETAAQSGSAAPSASVHEPAAVASADASTSDPRKAAAEAALRRLESLRPALGRAESTKTVRQASPELIVRATPLPTTDEPVEPPTVTEASFADSLSKAKGKGKEREHQRGIRSFPRLIPLFDIEDGSADRPSFTRDLQTFLQKSRHSAEYACSSAHADPAHEAVQKQLRTLVEVQQQITSCIESSLKALHQMQSSEENAESEA
ncbi:uncharacterized protein L969DRAFT_79208 [Mixia osmundae IAM 14324]|uniref:RING-type E3 ubiquitin transferase n=1 Tax=Mixia osmundae (strain CBS 9802 / IAM 14324 / JCM 22182 / KY 12970) TaxID=764103 RepID=G7E299_MIXOS|nr:uncharacterized protein L969DRAFT_79208 [Mixia osmundae IAM 14324]KEI36832.1 hypothetical protein L969DRAFT_79208 [Mixia osmundae IAM 14324]GAA96959.1 hypothetical protein E5Q_03633 [Mixia osmundae IAM 14324]